MKNRLTQILAHLIYLIRGRRENHALDDWLAAERFFRPLRKIFATLALLLAISSAVVGFCPGCENALPFWKKIDNAINFLKTSEKLREKIILNNEKSFIETLDVIDSYFIKIEDKTKIRGITQRHDVWPATGKPIVSQEHIFLDFGNGEYAPITSLKEMIFKLEIKRANDRAFIGFFILMVAFIFEFLVILIE